MDGKWHSVSFLDIRRSYARQLYKNGVDIGIIQRNLGLSTSVASLDYIGPLDNLHMNHVPELYEFDLTQL